MGGVWLDVFSFCVVFLVMFVLVALCERERH